MMEKNVLLVLVDKRKDEAVAVQKILTEWGCLIKTRIGLHDGVLDKCSDSGLIIMELAGDKEKHTQLNTLLKNLPGVTTNLVEMAL
ncbi:hypothetical protein ACFL96_05800 [Thermoproteota archaeon]